jgi:type I restriction enzyme S subunit
MTKLEHLIAELCPNGVEYKTVEEICSKISSGGTPNTSRSDYYGGDIPWLRTQEVDWIDIMDTGIKITDEGLENSSAKWIPENCVIIAMYGATAAKVAINKLPLTTNQACCNLQVDENKAMYRFVYYWLCSKYEELKSLGQGSQSNINAKIVRDFPIPLPPLPIQQEIVRILDNFTELIAELESEIESEHIARKKQYEYYRNELLTIGDDVPMAQIGDVCKFLNGKAHERNIVADGQYIVVNSRFISSNGQVRKFSDAHICPVYKGDILMVMSDLPNGQALAKCFLVDSDNKYTLNQRICALTVKNNKMLNVKFLFYIANRNYQLLCYDNGIDQTNLKRDQILEIKIPIPSLEEQKRIVSILDRFDALVNDITSGLPAEIAARRKQYEYYRNKLLTFREAA